MHDVGDEVGGRGGLQDREDGGGGEGGGELVCEGAEAEEDGGGGWEGCYSCEGGAVGKGAWVSGFVWEGRGLEGEREEVMVELRGGVLGYVQGEELREIILVDGLALFDV